jgi:hypothetical protein
MRESNPFLYAEALDRAAVGLADSVVAGLSPAVSEALGDPIVRALMAADRVDRAGLEGLLRTAAVRLQARELAARECQHQRFCGAHGA